MLVKEKVLQLIKELPDTFTIDELVDRMALLEKIQNGLQQSDNNEVLSTSEAKNRLKKWL
jgi:hypothetical protein